jgi:hypothetical protein
MYRLYTGIFTEYKTVSKLATARHILRTNPDVTLLRYYEGHRVVYVRKADLAA